ncbi:hypothetical protein NMY22_g12526 [Coprinellus aureogranulatus]|nr:hypothetical protein NMY22_g12526 [Coprinellus aureogranulatus]
MGKAPKITKFPRRLWNLRFCLHPDQPTIVTMPPVRTASVLPIAPDHATVIRLPPTLFSEAPQPPPCRTPQRILQPDPVPRPLSIQRTAVVPPITRLLGYLLHLRALRTNLSWGHPRWVRWIRRPPISPPPFPLRPMRRPASSRRSSKGSSTSSVSSYPQASTGPSEPSASSRRPKTLKQKHQENIHEPYRKSIPKNFRGAHSHIKYAYYFTFGDRFLGSPPPIPEGVHVAIGSVFILKKWSSDAYPKVLQSWLRVAGAGRERWLPLRPGQAYNFPHGEYIYSIDRSSPSWATRQSKKKLELDTMKRMAMPQGAGKRKRAVDSEESEDEETPSRRVSSRRNKRRAL